MKVKTKSRKSSIRNGLEFAICGLLLVTWGCVSGTYDDVDALYYESDASFETLVEPSTVNTWVQNGYRTDDGKRVVILDCIPNPSGIFPFNDSESWFAGNAEKIRTNMAAQYGAGSPQYTMIGSLDAAGYLGHIPGAIPSMAHEGYEVAQRNDGPMLAEHQVGPGDLIDQMLCRLGITKDDVIVLTTSRYDYPGFCPSRMFMTLRYWGFGKANLKVLNGGNKAYAIAGFPLEKGIVTLANVEPSHFSVTKFAKRFFEERMSVGELMDLVDSGRTSLADSDPDKVVVVDTRQPPAAYYFPDLDTNDTPDIYEDTVSSFAWSTTGKVFDNGVKTLNLSQYMFTDPDGLQLAFSGATNPPIDPASSPLIDIHMIPGTGPLAIPLGAKPAAFEGVVKGAKVVKSSTYNITIPAITEADGRYKSRADLLPVFAAAGIDGTKPIILYCNSGALASIYYYVLKEICQFQEVCVYDGSWNEWGNLAAYEPGDSTYVKFDQSTVYPMYPKGSPKLVFFHGQNSYFNWDDVGHQFVNAVSGVAISASVIKPGGPLAGMTEWDAVHRSEKVVFRATSSTADNNKTYVSGVNWPTVLVYPDYIGNGNMVHEEDEVYQGSVSNDSGSGPSPFVPIGGGC